MRGFKGWMDDRIENVYYQLDDKDNQQDLVANLTRLIKTQH
jgi:hypothetical protein